MSYIRRKRVPGKLKDGTRNYFYYYRVEGIRQGEKVKQVVKDYLGRAEEAIVRLQESEVDDQEKSKLLPKLERMIASEYGTAHPSRIA